MILIIYYPLYRKKKEKITRYWFREDAIRSLFGEALLVYILKKYYKITQYNIVKYKYGKPLIAKYENIWFNISHSVECVLYQEIISEFM